MHTVVAWWLGARQLPFWYWHPVRLSAVELVAVYLVVMHLVAMNLVVMHGVVMHLIGLIFRIASFVIVYLHTIYKKK